MKTMMMSLIWLMAFTANANELVKEVLIEDGRTVLAAQNGLTLYTFDVDDAGVSNCHGGCLKVWPALLVKDEVEVKAPYGVTERPDGSLQLTLNDEPLYFFVGDKKEGDINGDGLQNVWHIITL